MGNPVLDIGRRPNDDSKVSIPCSLLAKNLAVLGSVGSGKTVAAKVIIEESAMAGIPSIIIDPHGDIAKMALAGDRNEWIRNRINPLDAEGYQEDIEFRIWTPASDVGLRLCINPFASVPEVEQPTEISYQNPVVVEALDAMASGFTAVSGFSSSRKEASIKAFLNQLLFYSMRAGDLPESFHELSEMVQDAGEYLTKWGETSLIPEVTDGLLSEHDRIELSRGLRALTTGLSRMLFEDGVPLDITTMVTPKEQGKTPVNIILLNALQDDQARQAFVAELCRSVFLWATKNPMIGANPSDTRLLCVFDEVHQFLPPHPKNPAAKSSLLSLYKEGRKYGLGCLLATQQMTDVDYKALGNVNTGFFGRVTDPRERKALQPHFAHTTHPKEHLDALSSKQAGEFVMICRDVDPEPIPVQFRWVYGQHGSPITEMEVHRAVSQSMRNWAKELAQTTTMRLEAYRIHDESTQRSGNEDNFSEATTFNSDLISDESVVANPSPSLFDAADSVFTGDISNRTIHGAEKVEVHFNLKAIPEESEQLSLTNDLKKAFAISEISTSVESKSFAEVVISTLEDYRDKLDLNFSEEENRIYQLTQQAFPTRKAARLLWMMKISTLVLLVLFSSLMVYIFYPNGWILQEPSVLESLFLIFFYCIISFYFFPALLMVSKTHTYRDQNSWYVDSIEKKISTDCTKITDAIENFRVSSIYSNLYHQTSNSEFEVLAFLVEYPQVILRRRDLRRRSAGAEESLAWINGTRWDQTVALSLKEYGRLLIGEEPMLSNSEWAKREVFTVE